jgi:hypothetical protein
MNVYLHTDARNINEVIHRGRRHRPLLALHRVVQSILRKPFATSNLARLSERLSARMSHPGSALAQIYGSR